MSTKQQRKPRLLFVVNADWFFVSHRLSLGKACQAAGYEVHVAGGRSAAVETIEASGMPFHPLPMDRGGTNPLNDLNTLGEMIALFRRVRPDIVHLVTIKPNLYGGTAARLLAIPVVHAVSGMGYAFIGDAGPARKLLRTSLLLAYRATFSRRACRVIFQNPTDRDQFVESHVVPREKTILIAGSGVDAERFAMQPLPKGPPVVLLPARLLKDKGVFEFVEAARALKSDMPDVRMALVGRVDEENPAGIPEEEIRKWVAEGIIEWWGAVENKDMPATYARASLVVLPSYREGLPLALAEAQAVGRACITTDVPGCRDAIVDGETGWLVRVRDSQGLRVTIKSALTDREELVARSSAATEFARRHFAQGKVFEATLAIYRELGVGPAT
jgi:glycosyltransferase involved in cell wall biosynthesis